MRRRTRLCLPVALAIAACQAPGLSPPAPAMEDPTLRLTPPGYHVSFGGWPGAPSPAPRPLPPDLPNEPHAKFYPDLQAIAPSGCYVDNRGDGHARLRFSTSIGNAGPGHLQIRGRIVGSLTQGTQEVVDEAGRVLTTRDVGSFELHPDHGHFHVTGVARYELRKGGHDGPLVRNGKKISFCMEDSVKIQRGLEGSRTPRCTRDMQGITRGFADVYSANLPDQTFEVSGLASGEYTIVIRLDPGRKFLEASRLNNLAWLRVKYDARTSTVANAASYP